MSVHPPAVLYPFQPIKIVVEVAESLAGVVAPVRSTHEKLQHQANVNQGDLVIWRKVSLQDAAKHDHMDKMIHFGQPDSIIRQALEHWNTMNAHLTFLTSLTTTCRVLAGPSFCMVHKRGKMRTKT